MSYQNYLSQILDYKIVNFKFEHPYICNENFYLLTRLHIIPNNSNEENTNETNEKMNLGDFVIMFNIKYPIKYLKKFMRIYIQKEENEDDKYNKGKEVFINELIHLDEGNYLIAIYFQNLESTVKENTGEISIVYSNKNYIINRIKASKSLNNKIIKNVKNIDNKKENKNNNLLNKENKKVKDTIKKDIEKGRKKFKEDEEPLFSTAYVYSFLITQIIHDKVVDKITSSPSFGNNNDW